MKVAIYISVLLSMCICTFGEASDALLSLPWKIGDTWKVKSWRSTGGLMRKGKENEYTPLKLDKEKPFITSFEVSAIKSVDDFDVPYKPSKISERVKYDKLVKEGKIKKDKIKCFEVRVICPEEAMGFQEKYLLYFRKDTANLVRVLNVSRRADGTTVNSKIDYPLDPNHIIMVDIPSSIPLDWPNWKENEISIENKQNKQKEVQQIKKILFTKENGKSVEGFEIDIGIKIKSGDREKNVVRSVQKWERGALWWSEIKRYDENDKIVTEAELVDSNEIIKVL